MRRELDLGEKLCVAICCTLPAAVFLISGFAWLHSIYDNACSCDSVQCCHGDILCPSDHPCSCESADSSLASSECLYTGKKVDISAEHGAVWLIRIGVACLLPLATLLVALAIMLALYVLCAALAILLAVGYCVKQLVLFLCQGCVSLADRVSRILGKMKSASGMENVPLPVERPLISHRYQHV